LKTYGPEGWDEQQATLPTHGYAFHQCSPVTSAVAVVPGWLLEVAGGPGSSSSPTQLPKCRLSSQPHHPRKRRRIGAATPSSHQPIRHLDRGGNTSLSHKNLMCMRRFTVASPSNANAPISVLPDPRGEWVQCALGRTPWPTYLIYTSSPIRTQDRLVLYGAPHPNGPWDPASRK